MVEQQFIMYNGDLTSIEETKQDGKHTYSAPKRPPSPPKTAPQKGFKQQRNMGFTL
jgi:hypothetical protein